MNIQKTDFLFEYISSSAKNTKTIFCIKRGLKCGIIYGIMLSKTEVKPMLKYNSLSSELAEKILKDRKISTSPKFYFDENEAKRREPGKDAPSVIRTPFIRDIDKILHCPFYNRYADKTQVFSFYKNDDITRRALHVQLVSRIGRTIGNALGLNLDLIEAIAIGHDLGHTPFGHAGERFLDEIYFEKTCRHFSHNIHSVRVLDKIIPLNITLQTLDGIAAHNGELELSEYRPRPLSDFCEFDRLIEDCYLDTKNIEKLVPSTLEGCVVRISDIIAYLGKDRQDAQRAGIIDTSDFENSEIGTYNAEIINNLIVNIVENSYGKPYLKMDEVHFNALVKAKKDNGTLIYSNDAVNDILDNRVKPMMRELYEKLFDDLVSRNTDSPVFGHHIDFINTSHYKRSVPYKETDPDQIVVDYIASMTDDYFVELHAKLFPDSKICIPYNGYFE